MASALYLGATTAMMIFVFFALVDGGSKENLGGLTSLGIYDGGGAQFITKRKNKNSKKTG